MPKKQSQKKVKSLCDTVDILPKECKPKKAKIKKEIDYKKHGKRGMDLESKLITLFEKYRNEEFAVIEKIHNNWTIIRGVGGKIVSAFPKKSVVDFMGALVDGTAIAIEAKKTDLKTSFPFSNIEEHQIKFLDSWCKLALGFYIIWFKELNRCFIVKAHIMNYNIQNSERKSATLKWFEENGSEFDEDLDIKKYIIN